MTIQAIMRKKLFRRLRLKRRTAALALAMIFLAQIEPSEGHFDFSLVDGLIKEARARQLRLVPLWFGSWKNSMSCYAPAWVKLNQARFPRAQDRAGRGMEILSPFSEENVEADARAFAALLRHLRLPPGRFDIQRIKLYRYR